MQKSHSLWNSLKEENRLPFSFAEKQSELNWSLFALNLSEVLNVPSLLKHQNTKHGETIIQNISHVIMQNIFQRFK